MQSIHLLPRDCRTLNLTRGNGVFIHSSAAAAIVAIPNSVCSTATVAVSAVQCLLANAADAIQLSTPAVTAATASAAAAAVLVHQQ